MKLTARQIDAAKPKEKAYKLADGGYRPYTSKGMYRRAASRWLEVFDQCDSEAGREWITKYRNECLERRRHPAVRLDSYGDIRKAAEETQRRMGLDKPNGGAFRLKGKSSH